MFSRRNFIKISSLSLLNLFWNSYNHVNGYEASNNYKIKKVASNLSNEEQRVVCGLLNKGGLAVPGCAKAIDENPVKFSQIVSESPATSTAMQKLKAAATGFLRSGGVKTFGAGAAVGTAGAFAENATELLMYEAFYSYEVNDGMTVTPLVYIKETSDAGVDDETGLMVKTSFSF